MKNSVLERLPDDFNWEIYCKLNGDVGAIYNNKESAEKHYLTDGYKQNRRYVLTNIPTNFNWSHYLALNLDVYHIFKTENIILQASPTILIGKYICISTRNCQPVYLTKLRVFYITKKRVSLVN